MIVVLDTEVDNKAVKYTFKLFLEDYLGIPFEFIVQSKTKEIPENEFTIYYGFKKNSKSKYNLNIYCSDFWLKENYLKDHSLPKLPLPKYKDKVLKEIIDSNELPVLYLGQDVKSNTPYINFIDEKHQETNIDFIASSFYMVSRYEEIILPDRDDHDRFPAKSSIAFQENILQRPIVNEYVELFWYLLHKIKPDQKRSERHFELFLTHDIDNIKLWTLKKRLRYVGSLLLKRRSIKDFFKYLQRTIRWIFLKRKNTFKYLNYVSKKYGFKSHFYFLVNGTSKYDNRFDITSTKVQEIIKEIEKQGNKIGMHPSYSSYLDEKQILKEKQILDDLVSNSEYGVRTHYLRFKVPDTFRHLEKSGFVHDTSLGYSHYYGFRAGLCYPFKPFDIQKNREMNIIEYPLIAMDVTLTGINSPNLEKKELHRLLKEIIDKVSFFNGVFVFLMHNTSLEELEFEWRKIYEDILHYCQIKEKRN